MATWFTADLHFWHRNIIEYCNRPWSSVEEMNEGLVERWNSVVEPSDTVWVLGDVALSPSKLDHVSRLKGVKKLVSGNHDACWLGHRKGAAKRQRYLDAGFAFVDSVGVIRDRLVGTHRVDMSHLPYEGDSQAEERYKSYRPADQGRPLLCGHVHDSWRIKGRQINVGVDVWDWYPVSEGVLATILDSWRSNGAVA